MTTSVAYNMGAIVGGCTPMLASALAESKVLVAPVLPMTAFALFSAVVLVHAEWGKRGYVGGWVGRWMDG